MRNIKKKNKIKLKELTPSSHMCVGLISCPAIYQMETGQGDKLAIVGKKADPKELGIADKVSNDEQVVIIDREMLRKIFEK